MHEKTAAGGWPGPPSGTLGSQGKRVSDGKLSVLLNPRSAQTGKAMTVDGTLPAEEFLDAEAIALTGILEGQKTAAHGGNNLGLAADDPTLGRRRGQVRQREGTAVRANDKVFAAKTRLHDTNPTHPG